MGEYDALCVFPGAAPPPGVTPNFEDPVTLAPEIIAVSVIFMTAASIFVAGRLCSVRGKFTLADYFIAFALLFSTAQTAMVFTQVKWARHQWDIPACWFFGNYAKLIFSQVMLLTPGQLLAKASILLLFKQLFTVDRKLNIAIWIGQIFTVLTYLPAIPIEVVFNSPDVGKKWADLMLSGKPQKAIYWGVVQSAMSIALDLYIFFLPMPTIIKLKMSFRKRAQVVAVFSTALMAVVAAIVSLVFRILEMKDMNDGTWKLYIILLCTVVELNVAIIIACVPGMARFVRVHLAQWGFIQSLQSKFSSYTSSSRNTGPSNAKTWPINITTNNNTLQGDSRNAPDIPLGVTDQEAARHRYVELRNVSDSWLMKTNNSTIVAAELPEHNNLAGSGIVKTLGVEQEYHEQAPLTQQAYYPNQVNPQQVYHSQEGYDEQMPPQQAYHPNQVHPQHVYPPQEEGYHEQAPPQQAYYPSQAHPQQVYPPQGEGYHEQAPPQQAYYPNQAHPQQVHPPQEGYHEQAYHEQAYHEQAYHEQAYHEQAYHEQAYHEQAYHGQGEQSQAAGAPNFSLPRSGRTRYDV